MPRLGDATLAMMTDEVSREQLCDWLSRPTERRKVMKKLRKAMLDNEAEGNRDKQDDGGEKEATSKGLKAGEEEAHGSEDGRQDVGEEVQAAIEALKLELSKRFTSVYEAFVFLDMDGDASVTLGELRAMLRQLSVEIKNLDSAIRGLSLQGNLVSSGGVDAQAEIDLGQFCAALSWHELEDDHEAAIDLIRPRRERVVAKAMRLCNAVGAVKRRQFLAAGGTMTTLGSQSSAGGKDSPAASDKKDSQPNSPSLSVASGVSKVSRESKQLERGTSGATALSRGSSGIDLNNAVLLGGATMLDSGGKRVRHLEDAGMVDAGSGGGGAGTGTWGSLSGTVARQVAGGLRLMNDEKLAAAQKARTAERLKAKFQQVDWSWRRKRLGAGVDRSMVNTASPWKQASSGSPTGLESVRVRKQDEGVRDEEEEEEGKRQRLFELFDQYDADNSGRLDATEVCQLLSDLGTPYKELQVRDAIKRILPPGTLTESLNLEEFAQWWSYLNYLHSLGIRQEALVMASSGYMKEMRHEEGISISQELHDCVDKQSKETTALGVSRGRVGLVEDGEVRLVGVYRGSSKVGPKTCSEFLEHSKRTRKVIRK